MFPPNTQQTDAQQHVQRAHIPSTIRTRSQQQHSYTPIDMPASPLKEAMKNHSQNHNFSKHPQDNRMPAGASVLAHSDGVTNTPISCQRKRSSSPCSGYDGSGKRLKVLGQSNRINFSVLQHSKDSLTSPFKTALPTLTPPKPTYQVSVPKASPVMDLFHVARSPPKPSSPSKTLKITMEGITMAVPVTPSRKDADFGVQFFCFTPQHSD